MTIITSDYNLTILVKVIANLCASLIQIHTHSQCKHFTTNKYNLLRDDNYNFVSKYYNIDLTQYLPFNF